jgi:hypothetical protein
MKTEASQSGDAPPILDSSQLRPTRILDNPGADLDKFRGFFFSREIILIKI